MSDEDELLAAELALGLIEGEERRAAEARAEGDAAFALILARWQAYGAAMLGARDETPRPTLWTRIETRLPANDVTASPRSAGARGWKIATFASSVAAILLAVIVVEKPRPIAPVPVLTRPVPSPGTPLLAMLTAPDGKSVVSVSFDPGLQRLTMSAFEKAGHSAELWVIPADGVPRSLGLVAPTAPSWRLAPRGLSGSIVPGATLAVSIEPISGSPTGKPTGPVVLSGKILAT